MKRSLNYSSIFSVCSHKTVPGISSLNTSMFSSLCITFYLNWPKSRYVLMWFTLYLCLCNEYDSQCIWIQSNFVWGQVHYFTWDKLKPEKILYLDWMQSFEIMVLVFFQPAWSSRINCQFLRKWWQVTKATYLIRKVHTLEFLVARYTCKIC